MIKIYITLSTPRNFHVINYAIIFVFLSSYRNTIINQSACVFSMIKLFNKLSLLL